MNIEWRVWYWRERPMQARAWMPLPRIVILDDREDPLGAVDRRAEAEAQHSADIARMGGAVFVAPKILCDLKPRAIGNLPALLVEKQADVTREAAEALGKIPHAGIVVRAEEIDLSLLLSAVPLNFVAVRLDRVVSPMLTRAWAVEVHRACEATGTPVAFLVPPGVIDGTVTQPPRRYP